MRNTVATIGAVPATRMKRCSTARARPSALISVLMTVESMNCASVTSTKSRSGDRRQALPGLIATRPRW